MDKHRKCAKKPTFLNVADAIGAPDPCNSNLFDLLSKMIQDGSQDGNQGPIGPQGPVGSAATIPVPRHTYFVSPNWNTLAAIPPQYVTDIQAAIDAITLAEGGAPSAVDNYQILVFPGHYARVGGYTLASNIDISGVQAGTVFVDAPVVWNPSTGVNVNRITEIERVHFKDITFTAGISETVNLAKILVNTSLTLTDCQLNGGTYAFALRANTFDSVVGVNVASVGTGSLQFTRGGLIGFYGSRFSQAQPITITGDPITAGVMRFACSNGVIDCDINALDAYMVITSDVVRRTWTAGNVSTVEIVNCACDTNWHITLSGPSHADIWASPHDSALAITLVGGATVHTDYLVVTINIPASTLPISVAVAMPAMLDTNYAVQLTPNNNRVLYYFGKSATNFNIGTDTSSAVVTNATATITRNIPSLTLA